GRGGVAEDVRVPVDQLGDDAAGDVVEGERLVGVFLGDAGVEDDLEEDVAQFLAQFVAVALLDGLDEFVRLLDAVLGEALVGLEGRPRAFGADAVHDLDEVEDPGARQVVGAGEQFQCGHADPAAAGEAGQAVGQCGLALAGRDDDHGAAARAGVDEVLGGRGGPLDGYAGFPQVGQLRVGAVRAQDPVGVVEGLPGGPGQQTGGAAVSGGEQDEAAGVGGVGAGRRGTGCVHGSKLTHGADGPGRLSTGQSARSYGRTTGHSAWRTASRSTGRSAVVFGGAGGTGQAVWGAPALVTSRTQGVVASTRLLFSGSQVPSGRVG